MFKKLNIFCFRLLKKKRLNVDIIAQKKTRPSLGDEIPIGIKESRFTTLNYYNYNNCFNHRQIEKKKS